MLLRLSLLRECWRGLGIDAISGSKRPPPLLLAFNDGFERQLLATCLCLVVLFNLEGFFVIFLSFWRKLSDAILP